MSSPSSTTCPEYVAGTAAYRYPLLGDGLPPGGAKVLLLTQGGICVSGPWSADGRFLAWSPMPRRADYHYPARDGAQPGSGTLLLLTTGGICALGPWGDDGRYLGWARMPARDRAKEDALAARADAALALAA